MARDYSIVVVERAILLPILLLCPLTLSISFVLCSSCVKDYLLVII